MTLEIKPECFYFGLWHVAIPAGCLSSRAGNWTGCLWTDPAEPDFISGTYRFRWFVDERINDSEDERDWYRIKGKVKPEDIKAKIDSFHQMAQIIAIKAGTKIDYVSLLCKGDKVPAVMMEAAKSPEHKHWLHVTEMPAPMAEKENANVE